jgi:hypothetical protein
MRKLPIVAAFLLLGALVVRAQPPDAKGNSTGKGPGKGGGFAPKNLQVLDKTPSRTPCRLSCRRWALRIREGATIATSRATGLPTKRCRGSRPQHDPHGASNQFAISGRQAARDLLDLSPRQHNTQFRRPRLRRLNGLKHRTIAIFSIIGAAAIVLAARQSQTEAPAGSSAPCLSRW